VRAHLEVDEQGFAWLPEDDFVNHFAADVDPVRARVMHAVQQPLAWSALEEVMGVPAWKSHPTWFMVADGDQAIPPDAERQFAARMGATTVEIPTNHVAMLSHPDDVLQLIKTAAEAVQARAKRMGGRAWNCRACPQPKARRPGVPRFGGHG
jgi:pimeloyl-ACP methyl ester carboxylesterase